jgi:uncharacterized protein (DUF488 family)
MELLMSPKKHLLTIGYAGHSLESFLSTLRLHDVRTVVDVRQNPISRKKGFSRSALAMYLATKKIKYIHESKLGVPIELRNQLKKGVLTLTSYLNDFRDYLTNHGDTLDQIYNLAVQEHCCLLCAEHLPEECHRSVVAEFVVNRNGHCLEVVHV